MRHGRNVIPPRRPPPLPLLSTLRAALLAAVSLVGPAGASSTLDDPTAGVGLHGEGWAGGLLWPTAPPVAPGRVDEGPTPPLDELRDALTLGDLRRAEHVARRIVDEARPSPDRTLAAFALGLLYRDRGLHNLASEAFTIVRGSTSPIAEWGAFYEAEQDLMRGKPWVAIRECESLEARFPKGRFSNACARVTARSLVETGNVTRAREVVATYDAIPDIDPIGEQIELRIARRWTTLHPDLAVPVLRKLAATHTMPLTGRVAEELLAELAARGVPGAGLPDDPGSRMARAISLRDAKRKAEAWAAYEALAADAADDPSLAAWVEGERARFLWRTHRWDDLAAHYAKAHAEDPDADSAWDLYRALDRAGRFPEALAVAQAALKEHGRANPWRTSHEQIARTALLARDYPAARDHFDALAKRGGWAGKRASFYASFAALQAGDLDDALRRLDLTIETNRSYRAHARYWRARAYDALGRADDAEADRAWVLQNDARGWYAFLVRHGRGEGQGPPWDHRGRWPSAPLPELPTATVHPLVADTIPVGPIATPRRAAPLDVWASLTWPLKAASMPPIVASAPIASAALHDPTLPPASYRPSPFHDPADAMDRLAKMARQHGDAWPELRLVHDFARTGLYDLSGPLLSSTFEAWKDATRSGRDPRHAAARKISPRHEDWRPLFYAARDHHHTDRFTYGLWDQVRDPGEQAEALRLGYPLAHDRVVWRAAREHDVDPYLVLAILRVESRYDAVAVSRVGARGAMQIMPRTGALLADQRHDEEFLAGDLEDPIVSVRDGIAYLGQLLDRFDGATPLAVAAYNGGPFNVSSWLAGVGDAPVDVLVEHIPYRETRRYVRRVVASYQTYVDLYGRPGEQVRLPSPPYGDDPNIVDF
jgi:soluble lytic murein transglycosylase